MRFKKTIATVASLLMVTAFVPVTALAQGDGEEAQTRQTTSMQQAAYLSVSSDQGASDAEDAAYGLDITGAPGATADATSPTFSGGSGTEEDPYLISSVADLEALGSAIDGGNGLNGICFKLTTDISSGWGSFSGMGSSSDPSTATPFGGTFDGDGHTLSGLTLSQGLFGCISTAAHIENLTVEGSVSALADNAGMIAGTVVGSGVPAGNVISQCTVKGTVNGGSHANIGGIVGNVTTRVTIASCVVDCDIDSTATGDANVGGIVGLGATVSIDHSTWSGTISASGDCVGGIVGSMGGGQVESCYVTGTITGGSKVGGIVGSIVSNEAASETIVSNCRVIADITGTTDVGGVIGYGDVGSTSDFIDTSCQLVQGTVTATDATNGYAGGIVGYAANGADRNRGVEPSYNCILLTSISGGANTDASAHTGAVWGGSDNGINKPVYNYTWRHMLLNGSEVSTGSGSSQNGAEIGRCQLYRITIAAEPINLWNDAYWEIAPGHAPILRGLPDGAPAQPDWPPYQPIDVADSQALLKLPYTGEAYTFQDLDVTYRGEPLAFSTDNDATDYYVAITDSAGNAVDGATDAGDYKLTITTSLTGKAKCVMARTYDVRIVPASLADAEVSGTFQKTYDGTPQSADLELVVDGHTLKEGTDYVVRYEGDHTQVGEYPMDIQGIGDYTGDIPDYELTVVEAPSTPSATDQPGGTSTASPDDPSPTADGSDGGDDAAVQAQDAERSGAQGAVGSLAQTGDDATHAAAALAIALGAALGVAGACLVHRRRHQL